MAPTSSSARRPATVARCLITSTSEVYGKSEKFPYAEGDDCVMGPTNTRRWAYACAKALDEFLALAHWHETRLARGDRPLIQHGRASSDRPLRDGDPPVRRPGARR